MSVRVENYLIYGLKFGEEFTKDLWDKDFYEEEKWNRRKPSDKPFFLTDGMNGRYTFFGFITELSSNKEQVISLSFTKLQIMDKFYKLYPDAKIIDEDIELYFVPHCV